MFRMLRDGKESYRSGEVRAWAVRRGRPDDARELADVAQKILDRRALRAGPEGRWREDALEHLRREAAQDTGRGT